MECSGHGERVATFVCQHLRKGFGKGFNTGYDEEYPDDPFPDAWCDDCDQELEKAGEWNDENEEFAGITLMCSGCYLNARMRNLPDSERRIYTWGGLENVEQTHRENPRTFSIPRSDERASLQRGQLVKLIFELNEKEEGLPGAERMWVEIDEPLKNGKYKGRLSNDPYFIADLVKGNKIDFGTEHIAAVYTEQNDEKWLDESKMLSCAVEIVESEIWPGFAEHGKVNADDSGWKVYPDASRKSAKMVSLPIGELMNLFPVLDSIMAEATGTAWQWNEEDLEYKLRKN